MERMLDKWSSLKAKSDTEQETVHVALMKQAVEDRLMLMGQSTSRNQAPVRYLEYVL
jgi:hypothetical protein